MHELRSLNCSQARITDEGIMDVARSFNAEHRGIVHEKPRLCQNAKNLFLSAHDRLAMLTLVVFNGYVGGDLQRYRRNAFAKVESLYNEMSPT